MNDSKWFTWVGLAVAAAVLAGFGIGVVSSSALPGGSSSASGKTTANTGVDYVYLTIAFNPTSGLDQYFPGNFTVPAHQKVVFVITSYDDGVNKVGGIYSNVQGTVGGSEVVTQDGVAKTVSSWDPNSITHTFTVMGMGQMSGMNSGSGGLNAIVPPATSVSDPVTVSFSAYFNATGVLQWQCLAPCDPNSMTTSGLMMGSISVV